MALVDVTKACIDSFIHISDHINGAIVYLDSGSTESFQYIGAYSALVEFGASAVCSLENASPLDAVAISKPNNVIATNILVFTSRMLSDAHRYILRCLTTHPAARSIVVLTSVSEVAHSAYPDSPLGPDAYLDYKSLLLLDYDEIVKKRGEASATSYAEDVEDSLDNDKDPKLDVSVLHFPLMICPFSRRLFAFPSESSVAEACLSLEGVDSLSPGLPPISKGLPLDWDEVPPGAFLCANFLHHLADELDLKLEVFSMGELSKAVGNIMIGTHSVYDSGRRKRTAGLLLLDRTLDLLTPCRHGDSLFDRMVSVLPRRRRVSGNPQLKVVGPTIIRPSLDMQIPLQTAVFDENSSEFTRLAEDVSALACGWGRFDASPSTSDFLHYIGDTSQEFPFNGSFLGAESFRGTSLLEAVLDQRTKDGVVLVRKWLQETLRRENISVNAKGTDIKAFANALAKNDSSLLRNKGLIQLAAGVLYSLNEPQRSKWEALVSAENTLGACADDSVETLATHLRDLITSKTASDLVSIQDSLLLLMIGYTLAGDGVFTWQDEHFMKEAVVDEIFSNPSAASEFKFLKTLVAELEANANQPSTEVSIDDFDDEQWGQWGDEDEFDDKKDQSYNQMQLKLELRDRVDSLFNLLRKVSGSGKNSSIVRENDEEKGLLYKILSKVLKRGEFGGLEYHSSTVGRLFKSGLGRFGLGQAKPSLGDQNVIMVFVIGGISGIEVREAMEALSEMGRPDIELIFGGTTLLTPNDMFDLLLGKFSYF